MKVPISDHILHSPADEVVPYADSEELVRNSGLPAYTLEGMGGGLTEGQP
jgi:hypothetical protein